ncbi:hypothetical protein [Methylocella sp.]|uniref:hypothetical protein n=1 Tax=Methylocella sp. TaxID=1978226 RepID=UPI0035B028F7
MGLDTAADYVAGARNLLQDRVEPHRFGTDQLVEALNYAFGEIARMRPDMLLEGRYTVRLRRRELFEPLSAPRFHADDLSAQAVPLPLQYRLAVLYFVAGYVQLYDDEQTQDERASALVAKFEQQLTAVKA